ncbi:zinc ribbon domain-containing protein YjdM [Leucobacter aridicollis]|uniref:Protein PhnA n=1 Tax=Leucobacter aridicollis TaxID=283878 RepID=A0A852RCC3_9MICO|nr:zinc ribbon domain-containing protein YjdM [Leucobacter aridicollis]MBL3682585.1 alkylphosphonate utilization protein [Leucobacter aridicollis]NYD26004.1 protein PhnA [Leucobacter aridicollis]
MSEQVVARESETPPCPQCDSEFSYELGALLACPMCGHEWAPAADAGADGLAETAAGDAASIRDAVGNVLEDGDTVTLVKTVKVSGGGGGTIKVGTKVTGIRLAPGGAGGHDIDAKVPGFGKMQLKSSVVKKA